MPGYVPTVAEIETALKQLHDPEALRNSQLATLDLVHERVALARRATDHTIAPLPWIYGYELAALLRERIDSLFQAAEVPPEQLANQRPATRAAAVRPDLAAALCRGTLHGTKSPPQLAWPPAIFRTS